MGLNLPRSERFHFENFCDRPCSQNGHRANDEPPLDVDRTLELLTHPIASAESDQIRVIQKDQHPKSRGGASTVER